MDKLKKILFDELDCYEDYDDIIDSIRSYESNGDITEEEYDIILDNYDEWLEEWNNKRGE